MRTSTNLVSMTRMEQYWAERRQHPNNEQEKKELQFDIQQAQKELNLWKELDHKVRYNEKLSLRRRNFFLQRVLNALTVIDLHLSRWQEELSNLI